MNHASMIVAMALFTAASVPSYAEMRDSPVRVDTTGLLPNLAGKIEKHAAEGVRSLSRYLAGTRKYHNLVVEDVVKGHAPAVVGFKAKEYKRYAHEWKQTRN